MPGCPSGSGIGPARRSRQLHLKRPWLVPIADTRVVRTYRNRAGNWAASLGQASAFWEPAREDLTAAADDFERLDGTTLRSSGSKSPAPRPTDEPPPGPGDS
jgi:hypothetical protein